MSQTNDNCLNWLQTDATSKFRKRCYVFSLCYHFFLPPLFNQNLMAFYRLLVGTWNSSKQKNGTCRLDLPSVFCQARIYLVSCQGAFSTLFTKGEITTHNSGSIGLNPVGSSFVPNLTAISMNIEKAHGVRDAEPPSGATLIIYAITVQCTEQHLLPYFNIGEHCKGALWVLWKTDRGGKNWLVVEQHILLQSISHKLGFPSPLTIIFLSKSPGGRKNNIKLRVKS